MFGSLDVGQFERERARVTGCLSIGNKSALVLVKRVPKALVEKKNNQEMLLGVQFNTDKERKAVAHIEKSAGPSGQTMIFANFDAELLTGVKTTHAKYGRVPKDLIKSDAFQLMGIVLIDPVVNKHAQTDDYYMSRRQALNEACPQFSKKPASLQYCARDNGFDTEVWQPELGQYNGRVGVYKKILDEHGKQIQYCLVAVAGAEVACKELQQSVAERMDEIENVGKAFGEGDQGGGGDGTYLNSDMCVSDEFGYVSHAAATNVQRLLSDAAEALEIRIPTIQYQAIKLNSTLRSFPSMAVPDKLQPINTIESVDMQVGIYREVCPPRQVTGANNTHYVLQGPAAPIYEFDVAGSRIQHGLPSTTGRAQQMPINYAAGVEQTLTDEKRAQYESATQHVFWEGHNPINFDVIPGVFNSLARQRGQTTTSSVFLGHMASLGWNPDNVHERWVPVLVKCSDPFLNREQ